MASNRGSKFLQWALPQMEYRWAGFRKPRRQVLRRIQSRMQELGLTGGYEEYKSYLKNNPVEWEYLDKLCDITISKFFRDRRVWDYLRDEILYSLLCDGSLRPDSGRTGPEQSLNIWSAGCCNGEEPYSIAIILNQLPEELTRTDNVAILATDRNSDVLERAKSGCYPAGALKELTDQERKEFFRPANDQSDRYLIRDDLKNQIEFEQRDIKNAQPDRLFDLIFCRNLVFTYFTRKKQLGFLEHLQPRLRTGGYLVTGANEKLPKISWLKKTDTTHPIWKRY